MYCTTPSGTRYHTGSPACTRFRHSVDEIASAVIHLWQRADLRTRLCDNALDLVRRKYSWSAASERIVDSVSLLANRFV